MTQNPKAILSVVTLVVGLLISNGLITNKTGKLGTDIATAVVSAAFIVYAAIEHYTKGKVIAAGKDPALLK